MVNEDCRTDCPMRNYCIAEFNGSLFFIWYHLAYFRVSLLHFVVPMPCFISFRWATDKELLQPFLFSVKPMGFGESMHLFLYIRFGINKSLCNSLPVVTLHALTFTQSDESTTKTTCSIIWWTCMKICISAGNITVIHLI